MHDPDATDTPAETRPITLLLVDDHPVVRKGTRELLEGETDLRVIGEADSGEDAVHKARSLRPDVNRIIYLQQA
jgi:DNA-binding NarL/FixJ family response regulator